MSEALAGVGEWAGWSYWPNDAFESLAGPFYSRREADGSVVCAFRAEARHMNGGGAMHGGCLLTFADFALFAIGLPGLDEGTRAVTVTLNGEFAGPAGLGDLVEARGEVVRSGASLIFIRGLITTSNRPVMSFSGVVKKLRRRHG